MELTQDNIKALAGKFAADIEKHFSALEHCRENNEIYTGSANIETGVAGMVIFLSELRRQSGTDQWKPLLERGIRLLAWLLETVQGFDWSLYKGKAGIVYAMLDAGITDDLMAMVLDHTRESEKDFLQTEFVADFLYDGRAGTLLLLCRLYTITGNPALVPLISKYLSTILDNAKYTDEGIYWTRNDEVCLRPSCGMAFGVSGIGYVLALINRLPQNKALSYVLQKIRTYQDNCNNETYSNWGNFERGIRSASDLEHYTRAYAAGDTLLFEPSDDIFYQSGTTGILMADSVAGNKTNNHEFYFQVLLDKLQQINFEQAPSDLLNGIAGIGLLLSATGNKQISGSLTGKIAKEVYERTVKKCESNKHDLRLLSGDLGVVYFLLKMTVADNPENVLLPFFNCSWEKLAEDGIVKSDYHATRKKMLGKTYYRTLGILESEKQGAFQRFCDEDEFGVQNDELTRFEKYIERIISDLPDNTNDSLLQDAYSLEKKKNVFFSREKRTGLQFFLDKMEMKKRSLEFLNQTDETILSCKTGMSRTFLIAKSKWNWSFQKDMQHEAISSMPGKPFEYLFYLSPEMKRTEAPLNLMSVVMHQFDSPQRIADVIDGLKAMLRTLPSGVLLEYAAAAGSSSVTDFFERIDYLLLAFIKQMVYEGFLETQNIAYEIII